MNALNKNYQYPVVATDVVIFAVKDDDLKVLLIQIKDQPPLNDKWACPGGLVQLDKSVEKSAYWHLEKKTGLKGAYLEQLYTFGEVNRDPFGRVISTAYFALIGETNFKPKTIERYKDIKWFSIKSLPVLAYDHREIIEVAVKRLKSKLAYSNIVHGLLGDEFTLTQLQRVYEIILGHSLDKRNFRKKILSLDIISQTGEKSSGEAHRPANLYKFNSKKYCEVDIL